MRKKIYSKYLSNNSEIKFKQLLKMATLLSKESARTSKRVVKNLYNLLL